MGVIEWQDEKTVRALDTSPGKGTKTLITYSEFHGNSLRNVEVQHFFVALTVNMILLDNMKNFKL